jgi:upstream activation factor subunit UAF30
MLSQEMGGKDLTEKKKYIKSTLTEILDAMDNEEDTEEEEDDEEVAPTTRRRSGLTMAKQISTELATFLGTSSMSMARTDVVRRIWDYIKEHQLQNPEDKREILLDDKMKALFQCDKVTIFTMNKYVSSHMEPFPAVNLSEMSENSKKKKAGKAERRAKQESNKKRKRKNLDEDGNEKPKRVVKHPPFRLSPELSSIVGTDILPRPQVTRLLWVYIKKHNLQVRRTVAIYILFPMVVRVSCVLFFLDDIESRG